MACSPTARGHTLMAGAESPSRHILVSCSASYAFAWLQVSRSDRNRVVRQDMRGDFSQAKVSSMRCSACNKEFSVAWAQPSPGGSSAPGVFLVGSIILSAIALVLFWMDVAYWPWVILAVATFVAIQIPVAWGDCRRGGGACPKCKAENPVRPWSF